MQHVLEIVARVLQLSAHLHDLEFRPHGDDVRAELVLNIRFAQLEPKIHRVLLAPRSLQLPVSRIGARARNVLGAFRGDNFAVNAGLQGQHALRGEFAAGTRLGDLSLVAVEGHA